MDLSDTTNLSLLDISNNPLEELDLSVNPHLYELRAMNANLKELDLTGATRLSALYVNNTNAGNYKNELTALDTSLSSNLSQLYCQNNLIQKLDLRNNRKLFRVLCDNNKLEELLLAPDNQIYDRLVDGVSATNNQLVKLIHEPGIYNAAAALQGQQRTISAEKRNNSYIIDMKALLGNDGYALVVNDGILGGNLDESTGLLTVYPGLNTVSYPIKVGNPMGQIVNIVLNIVDEIPNEIIRIDNPKDQIVLLNGSVELPKEVNVIFSDGTKVQKPIQWEKIDTSSVKFLQIEGMIEGIEKKAVAKIDVVEILAEDILELKQNQLYQPKEKAKVKFATGEKEVPVKWEGTVNTAILGEKSLEGVVEGIGPIQQKFRIVEKTDGEAYLLNIPNEVLRRNIYNAMSKYGRIVPENVEIPRGYNYPLYSTDLDAIGNITSLNIKGSDGNTTNFRPNPELDDMTGIEFVKGLRTLTITDSPNLKSVDLSSNTQLTGVTARYNGIENLVFGKDQSALKTIDISGSKVKGLDLTGAVNLVDLVATSNDLASLNIDGLTKLVKLWIDNNDLSVLKTDTNTALDAVLASNNKIEGVLDLSKNKNLRTITINGNHITELIATDMPKLISITANNNDIAKANVSDCPTLYSLELNNNLLSEIAVDFPKMNRLEVGDNKLTSLDLTKVPVVERLNVSNTGKGEERRNQFKTLDLVTNLKLYELKANAVGLESINFGEKPDLRMVQANSNNFEKIDFSTGFPKISELYFDNNKLTEIGIPISLNWSGFRLMTLHLRNNFLKEIATETANSLSDLKVAGNQLVRLDFPGENLSARFNPIFSSQKRVVEGVKVEGKTQIDMKALGVKNLGRVTNIVGGKMDAQGVITLDEGYTTVSYIYQTNAGGYLTGALPDTKMFVQLIVNTDSHQFKPEVKDIEVIQNTSPVAEEGIVNKDELPEGTKYSFKEEVDTSTIGEKKGIILIHYPDGSLYEVDVKVNVVEGNPYDVNGDGIVNIKDASQLLSIIANGSIEDTSKYDFNKDGVLSVLDVRLLLNNIANN